MSEFTIRITDQEDGTTTIVGSLDDVSAVDRPPTSAMVIGAYICGHANSLCDQAMQWARVAKEDPTPALLIKPSGRVLS
jgi:hypothetical protein